MSEAREAVTTPDPRIVAALTEKLIQHGHYPGDSRCACGHVISRSGSGEHARHQAESLVATVLEPLIRERVAEGLDEAAGVLCAAMGPDYVGGSDDVYAAWLDDRAAAVREGGE